MKLYIKQIQLSVMFILTVFSLVGMQLALTSAYYLLTILSACYQHFMRLSLPQPTPFASKSLVLHVLHHRANIFLQTMQSTI